MSQTQYVSLQILRPYEPKRHEFFSSNCMPTFVRDMQISFKVIRSYVIDNAFDDPHFTVCNSCRFDNLNVPWLDL